MSRYVSPSTPAVRESHRIPTEIEAVLGADLDSDFDRCELLVFVRHDANQRYVADVDSAEAHWSADAQSFCVIEIRLQRDPRCE